MENFYESAEIVKAGVAHKLIQFVDPGKNHTFILECPTCTKMAWTMPA